MVTVILAVAIPAICILVGVALWCKRDSLPCCKKEKEGSRDNGKDKDGGFFGFLSKWCKTRKADEPEDDFPLLPKDHDNGRLALDQDPPLSQDTEDKRYQGILQSLALTDDQRWLLGLFDEKVKKE